MSRPPIRPAAQAAYLISNAQVTARDMPVRRLRTARDVLVQSRSLVLQGKAQIAAPAKAERLVMGNCTEPIRITEKGGRSNAPTLDTYVRCRKCESCLKHRRSVWSARAAQRIGMHTRSWMVTLTLSPANHFLLLCRAEVEARSKAVNPSLWTPEEVFAARWREFGKEVTKWIKRLRAKGAKFVYLLVVEAHKTGLPHVHLLIHEISTVLYRDICDAWTLGFSHAKLVQGPEAARYVTKYLMKSALARVRASQDY